MVNMEHKRSGFLRIDVETTGRQAEALRREIEELMVEDKTMSVTEIKVSDPMHSTLNP
jgi:hypothetical protein